MEAGHREDYLPQRHRGHRVQEGNWNFDSGWKVASFRLNGERRAEALLDAHIRQSMPGNAYNIALEGQAAGDLFDLRVDPVGCRQGCLDNGMLVIVTDSTFHLL